MSEDANTLRSQSNAVILDMLGEGPWEEFINGNIDLSHVKLDDVPCKNTDGTDNFKDLVVQCRPGTLTQTHMQLSATTEAQETVNVKLYKDTPIERVVDGDSIDIIRVSVVTPSLNKTDTTTGQVSGSFVTYKVEYNSSDNLTWRAIDSLEGGTDTVSLDPSVMQAGYDQYTVNYSVQLGSQQSGFPPPASVKLEVQLDEGNWVTMTEFSCPQTTDGAYTFNVNPEHSIRFRIYGYQVNASPITKITALHGSKKRYTGTITITGKCTSNYQKETSFRPTGTAPYIVRLTRVTPDSTSQYLNNDIIWYTLAAGQEEKYRYPGSVLVGWQFDSSQFSSMPTRSYTCKMLRVKIPSNYDPITRAYSGIWLGDFKIAWTDNPAWCFYDLLTNTRYGLGSRIPAEMIDKWSLYTISQYCDELVPNGYGGLEPRFTCNIYINSRQEAYKVISDFASIFNGITYWNLGTIIPVQDSPKPVEYQFNNSNVIGGTFTYTSSAFATRYNSVSVTWNDPKRNYEQNTVLVTDDDAIAERGYINSTQSVAIGCTSEGQARRYGRWVLYTNSLDTDVVTFQTGADGGIPKPGTIIQISDTLRAAERRGGRVKLVDGTSITLDAPLTFSNMKTYTIAVIDIDGAMMEKTFHASGTQSVITLDSAFPKDVAKDSIYIVMDDDVEPALFRTLSVSDKGKGIYEISATTHNPKKYDYIDKEETFGDGSANVEEDDLVVKDVIFGEELKKINPQTSTVNLNIGWEAPTRAVKYTVKYRSVDGNWQSVEGVSTPNYTILDAYMTSYEVVIVSQTALGRKATSKVFSYTVMGSAFYNTPKPPTLLTCSASGSQYRVGWTDSVGDDGTYQYEVRQGSSWDLGVALGKTGDSFLLMNKQSSDFTLWIKAVTTVGIYSATATKLFVDIDNLPSTPSTLPSNIASVSGTLPVKVTFPDGVNQTDVYIEVLRPVSPEIVNYQLRDNSNADFSKCRIVSTSDSYNVFRVPLSTVLGKEFTIKGVYSVSGFTAEYAYLVFSVGTLPAVTDITWQVVEPMMVLSWNRPVGATNYVLYVEEGGFTAVYRVYDEKVNINIPKYNTRVRIIAFDDNGNYSSAYDEDLGVSGSYKQNEVANVPINLNSGKYIGMGVLNSTKLERADLTGPSVVTIPITNKNSATLLSFGYNIDDVVANQIGDVPAGWFQNQFWRSGSGYYESDPVDLGTNLTGTLRAYITKTVEHHGTTIDQYPQVAAEYLAEYTQGDVADEECFLKTTLYVTSDDPSLGNWTKFNSGDRATGRYVKVVIEVLSVGPLTRVQISNGGVVLDVPDKTATGNWEITQASTVITMPDFIFVDFIVASPDKSCKWWITGKSGNTFTLNTDATAFPVNMDYFIKGY
jgi:predicted phage tail protein